MNTLLSILITICIGIAWISVIYSIVLHNINVGFCSIPAVVIGLGLCWVKNKYYGEME